MKKVAFGAKIPSGTGIFVQLTPKNQSLCQFVKCRAATNGAKPAKSIQQKHKPKHRAAPHTRPDTGKSPRKAKRNKELAIFAEIPYLCTVFLPTYRPFGIQTATPGTVRGGFFICCGDSARIWAANSGRFLHK